MEQSKGWEGEVVDELRVLVVGASGCQMTYKLVEGFSGMWCDVYFKGAN